MTFLLAGIAVWIVAGASLALFVRPVRLINAIGTAAAIGGAVCGIGPALRVLLGGSAESFASPWDLFHGRLCFGLDALGAAFLLPILVLAVIASMFAGSYWRDHHLRQSIGGAWGCYLWFLAGMAGVVIADSVLVFLFAWEVMTLAGFFLVSLQYEQEPSRRAGWIYLVAAHLGVAMLAAAFLLMGERAESLEFADLLRAGPWQGVSGGAVLMLALIGFGVKAGLFPLHVWLPEAHAAAPSHVSALMSGVMIKLGVYGLLRMITFVGTPPIWWSLALAVVGILTALIGIGLAVYQRDVKRVLAYSSVENVGLIALALGAGFWGQASGFYDVAILGTTAALLHVWSHAASKSLLFLATGSAVHSAQTRDLEHLGGLMRRMPWTSAAMLLGSVSISALPPLNGFVTKWLIYLALFRAAFAGTPDNGLTAMLAIGLMTFVGGLAIVAFARLIGIGLLGTPRSAAAASAHESSAGMLVALASAAALCLGLAFAPFSVVDAAGNAMAAVSPTIRDATRLESIRVTREVTETIAGFNLVFAVSLIGLLALGLRSLRPIADETWNCGYRRREPTFQYTARSFAQLATEYLLPRFLRPQKSLRVSNALFAGDSSLAVSDTDPFQRKVYEPWFRRWAQRFLRLRVLQQGLVNVYLAYIVLAVVVALTWMTLRTWWWSPPA